MDHTVPLFDRIKFLSIYQSNQEEFYRVRVSEYHQILSDPLQSIEDKRQAENTLSAFLQILKERCSQMDTVAIQGFGLFEPKKKLERVVVNPSTGKRMLVPPKMILSFKPGSAIKTKLKMLSSK